MKFEKTKEQITLHGLGFLQVILPNNQRLHVWHPDLPKRKCFEHSSIHDHRFGFISKVLVGTQINQLYRELQPNSVDYLNIGEETHCAYIHEGPRTKFGNRPWTIDYYCAIQKIGVPRIVNAGEQYEMNPYMLHSTRCEGICVTLMTKTHEENKGAHSYCDIDVEPDVNFNRKQWSQKQLWDVFVDAMQSVQLGEVA
ncbi:hypothetical protein EYS14_03605 [Alteromonadaceae bacterium M269]|nr:hypothetical protein EYS14_03605 [Alteromonadaceae bacterium M269]